MEHGKVTSISKVMLFLNIHKYFCSILPEADLDLSLCIRVLQNVCNFCNSVYQECLNRIICAKLIFKISAKFQKYYFLIVLRQKTNHENTIWFLKMPDAHNFSQKSISFIPKILLWDRTNYKPVLNYFFREVSSSWHFLRWTASVCLQLISLTVITEKTWDEKAWLKA